MNRKVLASLQCLAVAAAAVLGGYMFYAYGTAHGVLKAPRDAGRVHREPVEVALLESLDPGEAPVEATQPKTLAAPVPADSTQVEFLYVRGDATVTDSDGAAVRLEVVGRGAQCGAEGAAESPVRHHQAWARGDAPGAAAVSAKWCVPAQPGSEVAYRALDSAWSTDSGEMDADVATRYIRYTMPNGSPAALKAVALASCEEGKGCGYLASIRLGADDLEIRELVTQGDAEVTTGRTSADDDATQPATVPGQPPAHAREYRAILLPAR